MNIDESGIEEKELPIVYVGRKNMSYYLNVCIRLFDGGKSELILEGMGSNVVKAADVANFLTKFYKRGRIAINNIKLDLVSKDVVRGLPKYVSRIRIYLNRE
jgi:DNA-binding protein Alba